MDRMNCRYCHTIGSVETQLERGQGLRAFCTACGSASSWQGPQEWRGLGFASGHMKKSTIQRSLEVEAQQKEEEAKARAQQLEASTTQSSRVARALFPELETPPEPPAVKERPTDLIPIAKAARLVGRHPNTISTRINLGDLPSYVPEHKGWHPKKRQRLVSYAELMALYPQAQGPSREPERAQEEAPAGPAGDWVPCTCGNYLEAVDMDGIRYAACGNREVQKWLSGIGHPLHDILQDKGDGTATLVAKGICSPEPATKQFLNEDGSLAYQMTEIPVAPYQVARGRGKGPRGNK